MRTFMGRKHLLVNRITRGVFDSCRGKWL